MRDERSKHGKSLNDLRHKYLRDTIIEDFIEVLWCERLIPITERPILAEYLRQALQAWVEKHGLPVHLMPLIDPHGPLSKKLLDEMKGDRGAE